MWHPFMVPVAGIIVGNLMIVAVVGILFWHKTRQRELQVHQDMRIREMEHQQKMKEMELELEKLKSRQGSDRAA